MVPASLTHWQRSTPRNISVRSWIKPRAWWSPIVYPRRHFLPRDFLFTTCKYNEADRSGRLVYTRSVFADPGIESHSRLVCMPCFWLLLCAVFCRKTTCDGLIPVQGVISNVCKIHGFKLQINSEWERAKRSNPSEEGDDKIHSISTLRLSPCYMADDQPTGSDPTSVKCAKTYHKNTSARERTLRSTGAHNLFCWHRSKKTVQPFNFNFKATAHR
jgi:hypothetical protein